jgi:hypothetical protein
MHAVDKWMAGGAVKKLVVYTALGYFSGCNMEWQNVRSGSVTVMCLCADMIAQYACFGPHCCRCSLDRNDKMKCH